MDLLEKNIEMLRKVNPTLADLIDESEKPLELDGEYNEEDFLNLILKKSNQSRLVYENKDSAEKIKEVVENSLSLKKDSVSVIIGIGCGHLVDEILKQKDEKHVTLVIESNPWLIKLSFTGYDFSENIKNGEVLFACPGKEEIHGVIGLIDSNFVINNWNILADPLAVKWPEKYNEIITFTCDLINQLQCNTGTVIGAGKMFAENDIKTFPYVIRHRGVKELKDIYKDKPAVLVSTGPSLQKNIHLLMDKDFREKVIIIAIAQTLRILLAYDIKPDFITTVDYCKTNEEHFENLWDCDIPLIALNKTYSDILKKYKGPKFIAGSTAPDHYPGTVSNLVSQKGIVDQGGSVSHMNFGCAILMGCNPIILIGQDLGYDGDLSHNPNADASGTIQIDGNVMFWDVTSPDSHLKGKSHVTGNVFMVDGYFGKQVKTNTGLLSFITAFERLFDIYKEDRTIINATEGGVNLKHSKRMQLKDALKKYCTEKINKSALTPLLSLADNQDKIIELAILTLEEEIHNFNAVIKHSDEAIKWTNAMLKHFNNNKKKLSRDIKCNQEESAAAENIAKGNPTLSVAIHYANRHIASEMMHADGTESHIMKDKKDLKTRVKRNKYILTEAKKACNELLPMYEEALEILESYYKTKDKNIFEIQTKDTFDFSKVDDYFDKGNFAYPLLEARKMLRYEKQKFAGISGTQETALLMREEAIEKALNLPDRKADIKYLELIKESREVGKKKEYKEALKLLKKAENLPTTHDNVDASWGIATSLFLLKKTKEAIELFEEITNKYPDRLRYRFEYGCTLLNEDFDKGIDILYEVFSKTKEFDFFYKAIGDFFYNKGEWKSSSKAYLEYLKSFPDDVDAKKNLDGCKKGMKGEKIDTN